MVQKYGKNKRFPQKHTLWKKTKQTVFKDICFMDIPSLRYTFFH